MDLTTEHWLLVTIVSLSIALISAALIIMSQRRAIRLFESMIYVDPLTGLFNEREYTRVLGRILRRTVYTGGTTALLLIDLNDFKVVNDTYGHQAGDSVLREAAMRMKRCVRPTDFVIRKGGDEFVIILPDSDCAGAMIVAKRIYSAFTARSISLPKASIQLSASIGGSCICGTDVERLGESSSETRLYYSADIVMYEAKAKKGSDEPTIAIKPSWD